MANPRDIVLFHKKRELREQTNVDVGALNKAMKQSARELRNRVEDLVSCCLPTAYLAAIGVSLQVKSWFSEADKSQKLLLLTDNALGWAVQEFVQKDEKDAIDEMVKKQLTRMQKKVEVSNFTAHRHSKLTVRCFFRNKPLTRTTQNRSKSSWK